LTKLSAFSRLHSNAVIASSDALPDRRRAADGATAVRRGGGVFAPKTA